MTDRRFQYSSPVFAQEWDRLFRDGWTIIYVDAQMCQCPNAMYRAIGVKGAGWRYWFGGGYDIITDDPEFILDDLARNSPDLSVVLEPDWGRDDA